MNTRGIFRPCCNTEGNIGMSIKDSSYIDAFNSSIMQNIRTQMIEGNRPEICNVCWHKENLGITSYRQIYNKNKLLIETLDIDNPKLVYIDIKFDNKCNLQCAYCEENSSNQFEKAVAFFKQNNIKLPFNAKGNNTNFYSYEKLEKIIQLIPNLRLIKVTGGEPTISEHFNLLLDYILDSKYADQIEIRITTNLTLVSNSLLNKLVKFKHVYIGISVDAVDKLYNYIRYPYTFDKFIDRLDTFFDFIKTSDKFSFYFDCLVTSYNIMNIRELIIWYVGLPERYKLPNSMFKHRLDCNVHIAPSTHPLSIFRLPQNILDEAKNRYISTPLTSNSDTIFKSLSNNMPLGEMKQFTHIYDLQKNMSYKDYLDDTIIKLL